MARSGWLWIPAVAMCLCASAGSAQAQEGAAARPTLSIVEFDTDRTGWVPPPQLGATLADLLADGLVASGEYRVLDREFLGPSADRGHKISVAALREAAERARVDYLVIGSVTRFSNEQRHRTAGGLIPHLIGLPFLAGGVQRNNTDSILGLTLRVIKVDTGEIVATATAQGRATRGNISLGGLGLASHSLGGGGYSSSTQGAREALLDEALHQAVADAGKEIIAAAPRLTRITNERDPATP